MMYLHVAQLFHENGFDVYTLPYGRKIYESDPRFIWLKYPQMGNRMMGWDSKSKVEPPYVEIPKPLRIAFGMGIQFFQRMADPESPGIRLFMHGKRLTDKPIESKSKSAEPELEQEYDEPIAVFEESDNDSSNPPEELYADEEILSFDASENEGANGAMERTSR